MTSGGFRPVLVPGRLMRPSDTPFVEDAVSAYLSMRENQIKPTSYRPLVSLLRGASTTGGGGRPRVGVPIARSFIAGRRVGRVPVEDWAAAFAGSSPPERKANHTLRRDAIFFNGFLEFMCSKGWVAPEVLDARCSYPRDEPSPYWLEPAQATAVRELLERLVATTDVYDEYRLFAYDVLESTGVRPAELLALQAGDLDLRTGILVISEGKGSGRGKRREFPVDPEFARRWQAYVGRAGLLASQYLFYLREFRSRGGRDQRSGEWVTVSKKDAMATGGLWQFFATLRVDIEKAAECGDFPAHLLPRWIDEFSPQIMRKTYACNQLLADRLGCGGLTLEQLQRNLGHESGNTTRNVYLVEVERLLDRAKPPVSVRAAIDEVARRLSEGAR